MAKKQLPLISGLTNARNRSLVIALAVVVIASGAFAFTQLNKSSDDPLASQGSVSSGAPRIKSIPGGKASEKYVELQRQENVVKADEAIKAKSASIPTIIGAIQENQDDATAIELAEVDPNLPGSQDRARGGKIQIGETQSGTFISSGPFGAQKEREQRRAEIDKRREEQVQRVERLKKEQQDRQDQQVAMREADRQQKEYQATVKRIQQNMKKYSEGAYKEWATFSPQAYTAGKWENEEYKPKVARLLAGESSEDGTVVVGTAFDKNGVPMAITTQKATSQSLKPPKVVIKAGTVLFGVLDTAVNTDEKGPILATIVHGKYKGGKLIGKITHEARQEKALLTFDTLSLPTHPTSLSVSAVAIDPDTARTALASDVDKHYLLRYGSLFASSFLEGYSKAISESGSTQTTTNSVFGATTTKTTPELSGNEQLMVALGEVGKKWGQQVRPLFNTPYTVTINQGTGLGLLFISDADVTLRGE